METFLPIAKVYCSLMEDLSHKDRDEFLFIVLPLLCRLMEVGVTLRYAEVTATDSFKKKMLYPPILKELMMREAEYYNVPSREYDDGEYDDEEPHLLRGMLSDDLRDIYSDLKNGLDALENGVAQDDVEFEWCLMYWKHWGEHTRNAITAIHAFLDDRSWRSELQEGS